MRGLAQAVKGMKLVDAKQVAEQGKRAYRMGITFFNNPYKPTAVVEFKAWSNGWRNAQAAWNEVLRRNNGSLSGIRSTYAQFLPQ